jgi:hypothetical protein
MHRRDMSNNLVILPMLMAMLCGLATIVHAEFSIVSNSAVFDPINRNVLSTLEFSQPPDFTTDAFQYFIIGDPDLPYPDLFDSIIRVEETFITHDILVIRNAVPPVADPAAGGWGSIRGIVPFSLEGNILTFSAPLSMISDHSTDGHFSYDLESYVSGSQTGPTARGESTVIAVGQPGTPKCLGKTVSTLSNQYGGLDAAASALGYSSVKLLQHAIRAFCKG